MRAGPRAGWPVVALFGWSAAMAQTPVAVDNQNQNLGEIMKLDLVHEGQSLKRCGTFTFGGLKDCGQTVFTGSPFHLAIGSLAPQNGVGLGLAFTEVWHPTFCASWIDFTSAPPPGRRNDCHWSLNLNAEGEATGNGSWRAGFYLDATRVSARKKVVHFPGQPRPRHAAQSFSGVSPTLGFYSETTSLNKVYFYGLGPATVAAGRTDFGFTENVTGVNAAIPLTFWWLDRAGVSLLAEVNSRVPSVRGSYGDTSPSIERVYTEASAPGLNSQPLTVETAEGARFVPPIPGGRLHLNYLINFQQFSAPGNSHYSFRRYTADLDHRLDIIKPNRGTSPAPGTQAVSVDREIIGSISARLLIVGSEAKAGSVVPFYFSPTIGGSDINGQAVLASYPDYRFRAPNLMLLNASYEQSLGKIPIGLFFGVDEAKVGLRRDDLDFTHLRHSFSAGLTVHAGGFPVLYVLFAWGGAEGHHTLVNVSNQLLGPGTRPLLY